MSLSLTASDATTLDRHLWAIYGGRLGGTELHQLAKLFKSKSLIAALGSLIQPKLRSSRGFHEEVEIKITWIDKRPLAKLSGQVKRGEVGDAAVFFVDVMNYPGGRAYRSARALILQAKAAAERRQIESPVVPINPSNPRAGTSTARELALMSTWPVFDLYVTSGND